MNIEKLVSNNGRVIYVFQAHSFPQLITNLFLIDDGDQLILVDTGSAYHKSTKSLAQGIDQINEQYNQSFTLSDLGAILVTHGHIDHFGGLNFLREHTDAPIGIMRSVPRWVCLGSAIFSRRLGLPAQPSTS